MWKCHLKEPENKLANALSNWIYFKGHPFSLLDAHGPARAPSLCSPLCDKPALHPWQLIDYRGVLSFDRLPDEFSQPWDPPSQVFICLYPSEHFSGGLPWEHANSVLHCWLSPFPFFCGINTQWWVQLFCSVFPEMTNQPTLIMAQKAWQWKSFGDQTPCQLV